MMADSDQVVRRPDFVQKSLPWFAVRLLLGVAAVGLVYYWATVTGLVELLHGGLSGLSSYVDGLGEFGPLIIVALMTVAIVASPLPSAPVALVAGTLYGHTWGTVYVVVGAQLGATVAFLIARYVRPHRLSVTLDKWFTFRTYDSQTTLMLAVFASRLLPFVSFDLASYAAGFTPLRFWRFSIATLFGIAPASFLLAHVGGEAASLDGTRFTLALAILVAAGLLVVAARFAFGNLKRNQ